MCLGAQSHCVLPIAVFPNYRVRNIKGTLLLNSFSNNDRMAHIISHITGEIMVTPGHGNTTRGYIHQFKYKEMIRRYRERKHKVMISKRVPNYLPSICTIIGGFPSQNVSNVKVWYLHCCVVAVWDALTSLLCIINKASNGWQSFHKRAPINWERLTSESRDPRIDVDSTSIPDFRVKLMFNLLEWATIIWTKYDNHKVKEVMFCS